MSAQSADSVPFAYPPDKEAKEAVYKIVRYTGLIPNFVVVEGNVKTANAFIKNGERYIAYNPEFIKRVKQKATTDWAAVSVLAHEIGHHLLGHTVKGKGSNPGDELLADKFSGFILHQMGASLEEAQSALKAIGKEIDTLTHPPIKARLEAIKNGWTEAQELSTQNAYIGKPAGTSYPDTFKLKCKFNGDVNTYFINSKNEIVWFDNYGNTIVIGYARASEKEGFVWEYHYQEHVFMMDGAGVIWDETTYGFVHAIGKAEKVMN